MTNVFSNKHLSQVMYIEIQFFTFPVAWTKQIFNPPVHGKKKTTIISFVIELIQRWSLFHADGYKIQKSFYQMSKKLDE